MIASPELSPVSNVANDFESQITADIMLALRKSGYWQLPDLEIRVDGHDVILKGQLPSYYLKQKAHYAVMGVPGVHTIVDEIDVV